jgi:putative nucleotidyltransferase with HDIG domain
MKARVLIVDDERVIREVLAEHLGDRGHACTPVTNAFDALRAIDRDRFDLVLADIDMPGKDGITLLGEIKQQQPDLDVIMVTGVVDTDTAIRAIRLGASDYIAKPFNLEEVVITIDRILEKRRLIRENQEYQVGLEQKVAVRTEEVRRAYADLRNAYQFTLEALVAALDLRDTETQDHSLRVAQFTAMLAERVGVAEPERNQMRWGALLHDIGKIGIPDAILRKPGKLDEREWQVMRTHPEKGYRILGNIDFLATAREIVLHHQERWDGTGYPTRKKGEQIPLGARIFAVADTFDAMTSDRPYRKALPYERAREELVRFSGIQFDPEVVRVFCEIPPERWDEERRKILAEIAARTQVRAGQMNGVAG